MKLKFNSKYIDDSFDQYDLICDNGMPIIFNY